LVVQLPSILEASHDSLFEIGRNLDQQRSRYVTLVEFCFVFAHSDGDVVVVEVNCDVLERNGNDESEFCALLAVLGDRQRINRDRPHRGPLPTLEAIETPISGD
jgi:hypothetical protein